MTCQFLFRFKNIHQKGVSVPSRTWNQLLEIWQYTGDWCDPWCFLFFFWCVWLKNMNIFFSPTEAQLQKGFTSSLSRWTDYVQRMCEGRDGGADKRETGWARLYITPELGVFWDYAVFWDDTETQGNEKYDMFSIVNIESQKFKQKRKTLANGHEVGRK